MSHTPGPWIHGPRVQPSYGFRVDPVGEGDEALPVVLIPFNRRPHDEAEANARLIAAAPTMLDALREWKCPGCGGTGIYQQNASGRARAIERGRPTDPQFHPDPVTCKVCNGSKLHPTASAAITAAVG